MKCRHCGADLSIYALTSAPGSGHLPWCRENVPLARRVEAYANAMHAQGASPQFVYEALSEEDRRALKEAHAS